MAEKRTQLSIVLRTVDNATAKIKAINDRIEAATKPVRDFKEQLGKLRENTGLDAVIGGFKGVGSAISDLLSKVAVIGGIAGGATAALFHLVGEFDDLGDKAEHIGVSVDFLAQMRYAAERSGASVEQLDGGLQAFSKSLGQARAGTGRMAAFLTKVRGPLLAQLKAAKSNEEAFDLMAGAMAKIEDPARRAALAQAAFGDAELGTLFSKGPKGIKELRDRYAELAGPQGQAAEEAGKVDDAMKDLKASTDGIKAALVTGLAPALKVIVERLRDWFTGHRAEIAEWAKSIGEKLPAAIQSVVEWIGRAYDKVSSFIESIGGLKTVAYAAGAALIAGPVIAIGKLIYAIGNAIVKAVQLGKAMMGIQSAPGVAGAAESVATSASGAGGKGVLAALGPVGAAVAAGYAYKSLTGDTVQGSVFDIGGRYQQEQDKMNASRPSWEDIVKKTLAAGTPQQSAKITVDFANAPRGTRVQADPQSTADVDLSMGYQMAGSV